MMWFGPLVLKRSLGCILESYHDPAFAELPRAPVRIRSAEFTGRTRQVCAASRNAHCALANQRATANCPVDQRRRDDRDRCAAELPENTQRFDPDIDAERISEEAYHLD